MTAHPRRSLFPCPSNRHARCPRPRSLPSATARWPSGSAPSSTCPRNRTDLDGQGHPGPPGARATLLVPRTGPSHLRSRRPPSWTVHGHELQNDPEYLALELSGRGGRGIPRRCRRTGRELLRPGGPERGQPGRGRAHPRGSGRRPCGCAASSTGWTSPPTASWWSSTTRPAGPRPRPTSSRSWSECTSTPCCARRCSAGGRCEVRLLHLQRAHRHHRRALRAGAARPTAENHGRVVGHRAGLPRTRTSGPSPPRSATTAGSVTSARPTVAIPTQAAVGAGRRSGGVRA